MRKSANSSPRKDYETMKNASVIEWIGKSQVLAPLRRAKICALFVASCIPICLCILCLGHEVSLRISILSVSASNKENVVSRVKINQMKTETRNRNVTKHLSLSMMQLPLILVNYRTRCYFLMKYLLYPRKTFLILSYLRWWKLFILKLRALDSRKNIHVHSGTITKPIILCNFPIAL